MTITTRRRVAACMAAAAAASFAFGAARADPVIPELLVTKTFILDFEFDWGRDGVYCASCNQGAGNARLTFSDVTGKLWVGNVDPDSGAFYPANGRGVLADTDAAAAGNFGNGPEWMFGAGGSQIVYTKFKPGTDRVAANAVLGLASMTNGAWSGTILADSDLMYSPLGTLDTDDARPRLVYQNKSNAKAYWRYADDPSSQQALPSSKPVCARRWVPGGNAMVYTAPCYIRATVVPPQVYYQDIATGLETKLTSDSTPKDFAFAWRAPEFGGDLAVFTVANRTTLQILRQVDNGAGGKTWVLVNTIAAPANWPYISSPEPFVHNGKSYIVMQVTATSATDDYTLPTQLAITGVEPGVPSMRLLTNDDATVRLRLDPEYYITSQGPFVYYNRYFPATATKSMTSDGIYRVDTGLGPPVH